MNLRQHRILTLMFLVAFMALYMVIQHQDQTIQQQRVLILKMYKDCPMEKP